MFTEMMQAFQNIVEEVKMVSDSSGLELHDKATRGQKLSAEEETLLQAWYAEQDRAENTLLNLSDDENAASLQAQVETTLAQIITITKQIEETSAENDRLRREIASLRQQLAVTASPSL